MARLNFTWDNPNPPDLSVIYRLYEGGELVVDEIGETNFSLLMDGKEEGEYTYFVTAVDAKTRLESEPSPSVSINFMTPAAPTDFSAGWAE